MTHKKFFKDRHLYLTDCLIKKHTLPGSILLYTCYPYETLTLDHNIRSMNNPEDITWFSERIGPAVKVLKYLHYFDAKAWKIFTCFCNLKRLKLADTSITQMLRSCTSFMEKEQKSVVFTYVEEIKEKNFQIEENWKRTSTLAIVFPNLKKIISAGFVFTPQAYLSTFTTDTFKQGITYDYRKNQGLQRLLQSSNIYLSKIKFIRGEIKNEEDLKFVNEMCKRYPPIQKITMWYNNVPRLKCDIVTNLSIKLCRAEMDDFYFFQQLNGLKKLTIYISTSNLCLKWHEIISHTSLKCLTIHSNDLDCVKCYHNCIRSFPNVKYFSLYITESSAKLLMGQAVSFPVTLFPNLRKLTIVSGSEMNYVHSYKLHDELSSLKTVHHSLEYLHLGNVTDVKKEDLKNFSKIFPNLKSLSLSLSIKLTADEIVEALSKTIRCLRYFNLQTKCPQSSNYDRHEVLEDIVKNIIEYGRNVRTLGFPSFKRIEKTCFVNSLFNELSQLNFISFEGNSSFCRFYHLNERKLN